MRAPGRSLKGSGTKRSSVSSGGGVDHRQVRQSDAGGPCGRHGRDRGLGRIVISNPTRGMVQVVELSNRRVTSLTHFDVGLRGDRLDHVRCQRVQKPIHQLTPAPETVFTWPAQLSPSHHRTLKAVTVQIRRSRQQHPVAQFNVADTRSNIRIHSADGAIVRQADAHVLRPSVWQ